MAKPAKYGTDEDRARLVVLLLEQQGPMTIDDLTAAVSQFMDVEVPTHYVRQAIHYWRNELSPEGWEIIVETVGLAWMYALTDDAERIRAWQMVRLDDAETRMRTVHASVERAVELTDARTTVGRRARVMRKQVGRLLEDLEELVAA